MALTFDTMTQEQKDKFFNYLERLRASGQTNMYGAAPYLQRTFGIKQDAAREVLTYWMKNYAELGKRLGW